VLITVRCGPSVPEASSGSPFPLLSLLFVVIVRKAFKYWQLGPVSLLDLAVPLLLSMALVRAAIYVLRHAFSPSSWLASSERFIATSIWLCLALYITDLAPHVIDALEGVVFPLGAQRLNLWMVLQGIVTVFFTVVAALWVSGLVEARLMRMDGVDSSLRIVGVRVAKTLLTVAALVTGLTLVGIDMTAFSVFTGALGVGLGLGMQRIASNYVSGFIILLDRSIHIGDVVQVSGTGGQVSKITTRYTVLKNTGGVEFIVPNEALISNVVQNQSYSDTRVRVATTVGVTSDTDLDLAMRLMAEAASGHRRILADPAPKVLLTTFGDGSVQLELGFWIADPEAGKGGVTSDVNIAIWRSFAEHHIEIPFPQREVRLIGGTPSAA
jgi:small-conductance mechanosensitive channel